MKTLSRFVVTFTKPIVAVLSCFDRVIFKGYLPITNGPALEGFVDYVLKIKRCDFMAFAEEQSKTLVDYAKQLAQEAGAEYRFLQGHHRKDKLVDEILRQRPIIDGLICVLCCMKTCPSFKLVYGKGRPRLVNARRPQRVLYFYFLDPELGQIYVRLTTWFPFTVQVYVNGHSWLEKQMLKRRIGFILRDNAFTALDDPAAAQKLADSFGHLNWRKILNRLVRQVNPLMRERWFRGYSYYWVVDQAEYATDLIFTSRESLAGLYSRLLNHAVINFSAKDILTFLGRNFHPRFEGEVLTSCQKDRWPGARIKHRMKNNWLKMYDKFGLVSRIETVINNPREFHVRRWRTCEGRREMAWCPMNKSVMNLYRYREVALAANQRYLDALSVVENPAPAYRQVEQLTEPVVKAGRSYAGFNPASRPDVKLFAAVLDGDHVVRGFRNADIREALYGTTADPVERRRQSAAVGRLLKRLHVRGLIRKVPRSRRWLVSSNGHEYLKRQLAKEGIGYEELANGILSCTDPKRMQELADGLTPARILLFLSKWQNHLPCPFTLEQQWSGYRYQVSMSQVEFARTQVFDRPVHGRIFFEEVLRENIDLGRPDNLQLIFARRVTKRTPGPFRTRVVREGVIPSLYVDYKPSRLKQYFKEGRALRTELTVNDAGEFDLGRKLDNLPALRELGFQATRRLLDVEKTTQDFAFSEAVFREVTGPCRVGDQRASALRFGDEIVQALLSVLLVMRLLPRGFRSGDLREHLASLLGVDPSLWTQGRLTYQLRRLRLHGLIERAPASHRYTLTAKGLRVAMWFTRCHARLFRPALGEIFADEFPDDTPLRRALDRFDQEVNRCIEKAKVPVAT